MTRNINLDGFTKSLIRDTNVIKEGTLLVPRNPIVVKSGGGGEGYMPHKVVVSIRLNPLYQVVGIYNNKVGYPISIEVKLLDKELNSLPNMSPVDTYVLFELRENFYMLIEEEEEEEEEELNVIFHKGVGEQVKEKANKFAKEAFERNLKEFNQGLGTIFKDLENLKKEFNELREEKERNK